MIHLQMMLATLVFGMAEALQLRLEATGLPIPSQFLAMPPHLLVIFALVFRRDIVLSVALCAPYRKEMRNLFCTHLPFEIVVAFLLEQSAPLFGIKCRFRVLHPLFPEMNQKLRHVQLLT